MKYLVPLLVLSISVLIDAQARNDVRFGNIPYFTEQINPVLNRHRGRFRQFVSQKGSPMANIRSGRSITDNEITTDVECVYAFESLFCSGKDKTGEDLTIECDAEENFINLGLDNINEYALSDLRILKTGGESKIKMYMFGKQTSTWMSYIVRDIENKNRNILSIHSATDGLRDQGITVLDKSCWKRMTNFFKSMKSATEIDLMKNQKPVKIIARLNVL